MSIRDWFRRASRAIPEEQSRTSNEPEPTPDEESRALLSAWMAAMDAGELRLPDDRHDAKAWDRYWRKQIEVGAIEQGFNDMMASDAALVPLLNRRGYRTVLCAGVGLSREPLALFLHGFEVTAFDISDVPRALFHANFIEGAHAVGRIPGLTVKDDQTVALPADQLVDPKLCPQFPAIKESPPRGGGSLSYATGDLVDPQVCPGVFDVVIERRTVQLFPRAEQYAALDSLAARVASRGLLLSHEHRGNWRPGDPRQHFASEWVDASDFVSDRASSVPESARIARLVLTTG